MNQNKFLLYGLPLKASQRATAFEKLVMLLSPGQNLHYFFLQSLTSLSITLLKPAWKRRGILIVMSWVRVGTRVVWFWRMDPFFRLTCWRRIWPTRCRWCRWCRWRGWRSRWCSGRGRARPLWGKGAGHGTPSPPGRPKKKMDQRDDAAGWIQITLKGGLNTWTRAACCFIIYKSQSICS